MTQLTDGLTDWLFLSEDFPGQADRLSSAAGGGGGSGGADSGDQDQNGWYLIQFQLCTLGFSFAISVTLIGCSEMCVINRNPTSPVVGISHLTQDTTPETHKMPWQSCCLRSLLKTLRLVAITLLPVPVRQCILFLRQARTMFCRGFASNSLRTQSVILRYLSLVPSLRRQASRHARFQRALFPTATLMTRLLSHPGFSGSQGQSGICFRQTSFACCSLMDSLLGNVREHSWEKIRTCTSHYLHGSGCMGRGTLPQTVAGRRNGVIYHSSHWSNSTGNPGKTRGPGVSQTDNMRGQRLTNQQHVDKMRDQRLTEQQPVRRNQQRYMTSGRSLVSNSPYTPPVRFINIGNAQAVIMASHSLAGHRDGPGVSGHGHVYLHQKLEQQLPPADADVGRTSSANKPHVDDATSDLLCGDVSVIVNKYAFHKIQGDGMREATLPNDVPDRQRMENFNREEQSRHTRTDYHQKHQDHLPDDGIGKKWRIHHTKVSRRRGTWRPTSALTNITCEDAENHWSYGQHPTRLKTLGNVSALDEPLPKPPENDPVALKGLRRHLVPRQSMARLVSHLSAGTDTVARAANRDATGEKVAFDVAKEQPDSATKLKTKCSRTEACEKRQYLKQRGCASISTSVSTPSCRYLQHADMKLSLTETRNVLNTIKRKDSQVPGLRGIPLRVSKLLNPVLHIPDVRLKHHRTSATSQGCYKITGHGRDCLTSTSGVAMKQLAFRQHGLQQAVRHSGYSQEAVQLLECFSETLDHLVTPWRMPVRRKSFTEKFRPYNIARRSHSRASRHGPGEAGVGNVAALEPDVEGFGCFQQMCIPGSRSLASEGQCFGTESPSVVTAPGGCEAGTSCRTCHTVAFLDFFLHHPRFFQKKTTGGGSSEKPQIPPCRSLADISDVRSCGGNLARFPERQVLDDNKLASSTHTREGLCGFEYSQSENDTGINSTVTTSKHARINSAVTISKRTGINSTITINKHHETSSTATINKHTGNKSQATSNKHSTGRPSHIQRLAFPEDGIEQLLDKTKRADLTPQRQVGETRKCRNDVNTGTSPPYNEKPPSVKAAGEMCDKGKLSNSSRDNSTISTLHQVTSFTEQLHSNKMNKAGVSTTGKHILKAGGGTAAASAAATAIGGPRFPPDFEKICCQGRDRPRSKIPLPVHTRRQIDKLEFDHRNRRSRHPCHECSQKDRIDSDFDRPNGDKGFRCANRGVASSSPNPEGAAAGATCGSKVKRKPKYQVVITSLPKVDPHRVKPRRVEPYRVEPRRLEPFRVEQHNFEPHRIEHDWVKPHKAKPHRVEPHWVKPHTDEPLRVQPRLYQPQMVVWHKVEPRKFESRRFEPHKVETRGVEPCNVEPHKAELVRVEPHTTEQHVIKPHRNEPHWIKQQKVEPRENAPHMVEPHATKPHKNKQQQNEPHVVGNNNIENTTRKNYGESYNKITGAHTRPLRNERIQADRSMYNKQGFPQFGTNTASRARRIDPGPSSFGNAGFKLTPNQANRGRHASLARNGSVVGSAFRSFTTSAHDWDPAKDAAGRGHRFQTFTSGLPQDLGFNGSLSRQVSSAYKKQDNGKSEGRESGNESRNVTAGMLFEVAPDDNDDDEWLHSASDEALLISLDILDRKLDDMQTQRTESTSRTFVKEAGQIEMAEQDHAQVDQSRVEREDRQELETRSSKFNGGCQGTENVHVVKGIQARPETAEDARIHTTVAKESGASEKKPVSEKRKSFRNSRGHIPSFTKRSLSEHMPKLFRHGVRTFYHICDHVTRSGQRECKSTTGQGVRSRTYKARSSGQIAQQDQEVTLPKSWFKADMAGVERPLTCLSTERLKYIMEVAQSLKQPHVMWRFPRLQRAVGHQVPHGSSLAHFLSAQQTADCGIVTRDDNVVERPSRNQKLGNRKPSLEADEDEARSIEARKAVGISQLLQNDCHKLRKEVKMTQDNHLMTPAEAGTLQTSPAQPETLGEMQLLTVASSVQVQATHKNNKDEVKSPATPQNHSSVSVSELQENCSGRKSTACAGHDVWLQEDTSAGTLGMPVKRLTRTLSSPGSRWSSGPEEIAKEPQGTWKFVKNTSPHGDKSGGVSKMCQRVRRTSRSAISTTGLMADSPANHNKDTTQSLSSTENVSCRNQKSFCSNSSTMFGRSASKTDQVKSPTEQFTEVDCSQERHCRRTKLVRTVPEEVLGTSVQRKPLTPTNHKVKKKVTTGSRFAGKDQDMMGKNPDFPPSSCLRNESRNMGQFVVVGDLSAINIQANKQLNVCKEVPGKLARFEEFQESGRKTESHHRQQGRTDGDVKHSLQEVTRLQNVGSADEGHSVVSVSDEAAETKAHTGAHDLGIPTPAEVRERWRRRESRSAHSWGRRDGQLAGRLSGQRSVDVGSAKSAPYLVDVGNPSESIDKLSFLGPGRSGQSLLKDESLSGVKNFQTDRHRQDSINKRLESCQNDSENQRVKSSNNDSTNTQAESQNDSTNRRTESQNDSTNRRTEYENDSTNRRAESHGVVSDIHSWDPGTFTQKTPSSLYAAESPGYNRHITNANTLNTNRQRHLSTNTANTNPPFREAEDKCPPSNVEVQMDSWELWSIAGPQPSTDARRRTQLCLSAVLSQPPTDGWLEKPGEADARGELMEAGEKADRKPAKHGCVARKGSISAGHLNTAGISRTDGVVITSLSRKSRHAEADVLIHNGVISKDPHRKDHIINTQFLRENHIMNTDHIITDLPRKKHRLNEDLPRKNYVINEDLKREIDSEFVKIDFDNVPRRQSVSYHVMDSCIQPDFQGLRSKLHDQGSGQGGCRLTTNTESWGMPEKRPLSGELASQGSQNDTCPDDKRVVTRRPGNTLVRTVSASSANIPGPKFVIDSTIRNGASGIWVRDSARERVLSCIDNTRPTSCNENTKEAPNTENTRAASSNENAKEISSMDSTREDTHTLKRSKWIQKLLSLQENPDTRCRSTKPRAADCELREGLRIAVNIKDKVCCRSSLSAARRQKSDDGKSARRHTLLYNRLQEASRQKLQENHSNFQKLFFDAVKTKCEQPSPKNVETSDYESAISIKVDLEKLQLGGSADDLQQRAPPASDAHERSSQRQYWRLVRHRTCLSGDLQDPGGDNLPRGVQRGADLDKSSSQRPCWRSKRQRTHAPGGLSGYEGLKRVVEDSGQATFVVKTNLSHCWNKLCTHEGSKWKSSDKQSRNRWKRSKALPRRNMACPNHVTIEREGGSLHTKHGTLQNDSCLEQQQMPSTSPVSCCVKPLCYSRRLSVSDKGKPPSQHLLQKCQSKYFLLPSSPRAPSASSMSSDSARLHGEVRNIVEHRPSNHPGRRATERLNSRSPGSRSETTPNSGQVCLVGRNNFQLLNPATYKRQTLIQSTRPHSSLSEHVDFILSKSRYSDALIHQLSQEKLASGTSYTIVSPYQQSSDETLLPNQVRDTEMGPAGQHWSAEDQDKRQQHTKLCFLTSQVPKPGSRQTQVPILPVCPNKQQAHLRVKQPREDSVVGQIVKMFENKFQYLPKGNIKRRTDDVAE